MKYLKEIAAVGLSVCALAAVAACGTPSPESQTGPSVQIAAKPVESLTIAIGNDENTLAPFTYGSGTGKIANRLIYDTLFTTDLENNIIPWMVESGG